MKRNVYKANVVEQLQDALGSCLYSYCEKTIRAYISTIGHEVWRLYQQDDLRLRPIFDNYHPKYIGRTWDEIRESKLTFADVLDAVAYYFSYKGYEEVPDADLDNGFEQAVDILLGGDLDELSTLLSEAPDFLTQRSQYGHDAMLWHYLGSNGIELHRQVVPYNLYKIIGWFIDRGVDSSATFKIYGGEYTMQDMLATSAHPKAIGIVEKCLATISNKPNEI